jgi:hypothetical protein
MRATIGSTFAAAFSVILLGIACGGGGSSTPAPPTSPSPPPSGGGSAAATIRITSAGVDPRDVTIAVGGRVTFINSDTRAHEPSSDPHPTHTICPEINVGRLNPGQSRDTNPVNRAVRCGFHDHDDPTNASLTGSITIQ